jgi:hypothetical protein
MKNQNILLTRLFSKKWGSSTTHGCQMVLFSNQKTNFGKIWRALE